MHRTLHLSVLCSAIVIAVVSCQNTGPSEEKFQHDFDSAQKKLDRAFKSVDQTAFLLYESVIAKYSELFIENLYLPKDLKWICYTDKKWWDANKTLLQNWLDKVFSLIKK